MFTLNQIKEYLIQFFDNHLQINTVVYADDFDFSAKADVLYKVAHIQSVDPSSVNANEITYKFKIAIGDIEDPNNQDSENDIWSDCISIANDFISYFGNDDFEDFFIDKNITITKFSEGNTDRVAGVVFAFGVRQERLNNPCTLPMINPFTGITFSGNIVYPNGYYNLLQPYLTILSASSLYQPKGNYLTGATVDLSDYYTKEQSNNKFLTGFTVDFSDYYTKEQSDNKYLTGFTVDLSGYQQKGNYVSASTLSGYQIAGNYVSASTLNNYQLSGNYVSASTLNNYYTQIQSDTKYLTGYTLTATTLAGFGITDAYTKVQSDSKYLTGYTLTATTLAGFGISSGDTLFDKKYLINFSPISANTLFVSGISLFQQTNLSSVSADGLILSNNTIATSGITIPYSPRFRFNTHVWNISTGVTGGDNQFDFINELRPVSAAVPTGKLFWSARESSGGTGSFTDVMNLDNSGNLTVTGGLTAGSNTTINGSITILNNTVTSSILANNNIALNLQIGRAYSTAINAIAVYAGGATITNSTGLFGGIVFTPTYNQTGSASSTDILINRIETSVGSGNHLFINAQVSGTSKFIVDHSGNITGNTLTILSVNTLSGYHISSGDTLFDGKYLNVSASTLYQPLITVTTSGSSGAATFGGGYLNIPQYSGNTYSGGTPSALVGLSAITGSASTFLRSDAAPAINQSIAPNWTGLHTFKQISTGATTIDAILISPSNSATSAATTQWSPQFHQQAFAWNPTALASQSIDFYSTVQANSANPVNGVWTMYGAVNGGTPNQLFTIDNFGDVAFYQAFFLNKYFINNTSTDGFVFNNAAAATLATPIQKSTRTRYVGSVWNNSSSSANYFGFTNEASAVSGTTPTSSLDWYGYLGASSTPTFTKLMSLDAATGNLSLSKGKILVATGTSAGVASLVSGTVIVSTASISTNSIVILNYNSTSGTIGVLAKGTVVNGTSFVINSLQAGTSSSLNTADSSSVSWMIIN